MGGFEQAYQDGANADRDRRYEVLARNELGEVAGVEVTATSVLEAVREASAELPQRYRVQAVRRIPSESRRAAERQAPAADSVRAR